MPFNFDDFKKQISDSIEEGKNAKDQDHIAELVEEFTPKILKAFQEATDGRYLSATISLEQGVPAYFVDFLESVVRCDVICTARQYSKDYALVFRHRPTFTGDSMIVESKKYEGFGKFTAILTKAYEQWEDALVKKFSEPAFEAIKKGRNAVTFDSEIPSWIKRLFTDQHIHSDIIHNPKTGEWILHLNVVGK